MFLKQTVETLTLNPRILTDKAEEEHTATFSKKSQKSTICKQPTSPMVHGETFETRTIKLSHLSVIQLIVHCACGKH